MYQSWRRVHGRTQMSGAGFVVPPVAPSGTPFVLTQTLGTLNAGINTSAGIRFVATATNTITHLGRWVISGNNQTHTLYLMSYDGTFHDLGNCTVNTSGATPGEYLYCALSSPVVIDTTPQHYYVLSSETSGGDQLYLDNTTIDSVTAGIGTVEGSSSDGTTPPVAPGLDSAGSKMYIPVNFKVQ